VIDFGDGQTYTIAAVQSQQAPRSQEIDSAPQMPVSKEERFAEDFDRSWPPRGPPTMTGQGSRAIYNDRSNRLEAHADKLANQAAPPTRPQQILSRQGYGDRAVDRGYAPRQSDRSAHTDEYDNSRQPPPHLREVPGRHLPPHLADRGQERAFPSQDMDRSSGSSRPLNHDLPPHLRDNAMRPPPPRADRHMPPHLEGVQDYETSSRTNRWPGRDKEPDADRIRLDSGRPRMQPHSQGSLPNREPSSDSAPGASPKVQIGTAPAVAPSPEAALAPVLPPATDDVEVPIDQKDEMHEAAERARLRRQQEESEREARAERARQKAKQLEDMMREKAVAQASSSEAPAPPRSPVVAKILARPVEAVPATTLSSETTRVPPPHLTLASRPAEINRPEIRRSEQQDVWRRSPQQVLAAGSGGNSRAAGIQQSHGEVSKPTAGSADGSRANRNAARSPIAKLGSIALPADALDRPSTVTPVMVEFSELGQVAEEVREAAARPPTEAHIDEPRFGSRLNDAGTWRRTAESHRQAESAAAMSARRDDIRLSGLMPREKLPDVAERAAEEADPEPHYPYAMDGKTRRASRSAEPENNFDEIMARIKSAIVAESSASVSHTRVLPPPKTMPGKDETKEDAKDRSSIVPPPLPTKPVRVPSATYIVLPRPIDFITTQASLPMDPAPAWKTFTVKLPKSNRPQKTLPRKRTRSEHVPATPRGWVNTWNPPFEQLNPNTLSRDDWLIPANYIRGKAVPSVSLPRKSFQPHIKPINREPSIATSVEGGRSPLAKESSQTVTVDEPRPIETVARKIVVNLPRMTLRQSGSPVSQPIVPPQLQARSDLQASAEYAPEAAQTTEDLDSLLASPTPSEKYLGPPMGKDRETLRQISGRKLPEGTGVVCARPHATSISEETEQPSSMRFMVSSELEIDNLLEEVNNMSMDGLTETIPETSHEVVLQRESAVSLP
jgi:hypothetical protein